jgi:putative endonuclease
MYYVYILYSESIKEYYCGQTNDLFNRIARHNKGETPSIKHGIPWKPEGYIELATRSESMRLEKQIKKRGIKRWLAANRAILQNEIFGR